MFKFALVFMACFALALAIPPMKADQPHFCCKDEVDSWKTCMQYASSGECQQHPECMWCPYSVAQLQVLLEEEVCIGKKDKNGAKCDCAHICPQPAPVNMGLCYNATAPTCILENLPVPWPIVKDAACNPGALVSLETGKCPKPEHPRLNSNIRLPAP